MENFDIRLSYFKKAAKLPNSISICPKTPPWFYGKQAAELFCSTPLYNSCFHAHNITPEEFAIKYTENVLSNLDPMEILEKYNHKVWLGWYAHDKFDIRVVVKKWIYLTTGIKLQELTDEELAIMAI